eukprot:scaffold161133_cov17-Tisochrysis_lutea.AAC.1
MYFHRKEFSCSFVGLCKRVQVEKAKQCMLDASTASQTVLVLGAGGGVGLAAVQISKVLGAKVIAVTQ